MNWSRKTIFKTAKISPYFYNNGAINVKSGRVLVDFSYTCPDSRTLWIDSSYTCPDSRTLWVDSSYTFPDSRHFG